VEFGTNVKLKLGNKQLKRYGEVGRHGMVLGIIGQMYVS